MNKKPNNLQISPYINEIIEKKPVWLVRYGIGAMLFFLILVVWMAWWVKYPDIITAQVSITTPRPPIDVVANSSAPVARRFALKENDTLLKGNVILLQENTASYHQVQQLYGVLKDSTPLTQVWLDSLGNLQRGYNAFALAKLNLDHYTHELPYDQRIKMLRQIKSGNALGMQYSKTYQGRSEEDLKLKQKEHDRYEALHKKGVISTSEFEQIKQTLLQKKMGYTNDFKEFVTSHPVEHATKSEKIVEHHFYWSEKVNIRETPTTYLDSKKLSDSYGVQQLIAMLDMKPDA